MSALPIRGGVYGGSVILGRTSSELCLVKVELSDLRFYSHRYSILVMIKVKYFVL